MTTYNIPVNIQDLQYYDHEKSVQLESGIILPQLTIGYHTFGTLNKTRDNVIWVCHALTANSDVREWWGDLLGPGKLFDTDKYFVVCANILGSCYGTTGPRSRNPKDHIAYGLQFPTFTMRDIAKVNLLLKDHLNIEEIALLIGGSCGGHQCLEMALKMPERVQNMVLLATSARESAWAIALHEAGRLALTADPTFRENQDRAGATGLKAARAQALLGYRTIQSYIKQQTDTDDQKIDEFKAASYVQYQGIKLERRFYAQCYYYLLKALDTHNIGRNRNSIEAALNQLNMPTVVIGIDSDMLIPIPFQQMLADHLPNGHFRSIPSEFGHDGFLIETDAITKAVQSILPQF